MVPCSFNNRLIVSSIKDGECVLIVVSVLSALIATIYSDIMDLLKKTGVQAFIFIELKKCNNSGTPHFPRAGCELTENSDYNGHDYSKFA